MSFPISSFPFMFSSLFHPFVCGHSSCFFQRTRGVSGCFWGGNVPESRNALHRGISGTEKGKPTQHLGLPFVEFHGFIPWDPNLHIPLLYLECPSDLYILTCLLLGNHPERDDPPLVLYMYI